MKFSVALLALFALSISCKQKSKIIDPKEVTTNFENNLNPIDSNQTDSLSGNLATNQNLEKSLEDDVVEDEFIYLPFSPSKVMKRLGLSKVNEDRSVQTLLASPLRESDALRPHIIETGDGTFDTYMLSIDGYDSVVFYYESDVITTIEVISSIGAPADMIGPGLAYENIKSTYENPIAYGSEIEARVYVHLDSLSIRLATSYGIPEPIEIEDDTEILYIGF
ncbi:hypothetical protein [Nonlabens marinus]|uniref:Uncharacterized protein n=1 Tax=Nonlabens marinus S1-08 TaxID=1454201 RepID=W8VSR7_9FLAO|nr:hypothetical protein [Nonlabens marinus]BAO56445.1 hypothetical protein NMS_2436 [Nonlabens marinus S1-08]